MPRPARRRASTRSAGFAALPDLLPRTDWLILACPLTETTRGLIDARALALLPPGRHLINVSRGGVVVEEALLAALRSGHLAGAFLDVFTMEPLPAESPFWDLPNVIVSPHSAAASDGLPERVAAIFCDNLRRFRSGEPLAERRAAGRLKGRPGRRYSPRTPHLFLEVGTRRAAGADSEKGRVGFGEGILFPPQPCLSAARSSPAAPGSTASRR